eukprot:600363-Prorocentrum_minimum.AAC.3
MREYVCSVRAANWSPPSEHQSDYRRLRISCMCTDGSCERGCERSGERGRAGLRGHLQRVLELRLQARLRALDLLPGLLLHLALHPLPVLRELRGQLLDDRRALHLHRSRQLRPLLLELLHGALLLPPLPLDLRALALEPLPLQLQLRAVRAQDGLG